MRLDKATYTLTEGKTDTRYKLQLPLLAKRSIEKSKTTGAMCHLLTERSRI